MASEPASAIQIRVTISPARHAPGPNPQPVDTQDRERPSQLVPLHRDRAHQEVSLLILRHRTKSKQQYTSVTPSPRVDQLTEVESIGQQHSIPLYSQGQHLRGGDAGSEVPDVLDIVAHLDQPIEDASVHILVSQQDHGAAVEATRSV